MELVAPVGSPSESAPDRRIAVSLNVGTRSGRLQVADNSAHHPAGDIGVESATALARQIGGTLVSNEGAASAMRFGRVWRLDFPLPIIAA